MNKLSDGEMIIKTEETNDYGSTPCEEPPDSFMSSAQNGSLLDHGPTFRKFVLFPGCSALLCCDWL